MARWAAAAGLLSLLVLARVAGASARASDVQAAEKFDEIAVEWAHKQDGLVHARKMVETALSEKKLALEHLPQAKRATGGLGCTGLLGESKATRARRRSRSGAARRTSRRSCSTSRGRRRA